MREHLPHPAERIDIPKPEGFECDECLSGFVTELIRDLARRIDADRAGVGPFARRGILAEGFADRVGAPLNIKQIIDNLELQPDRFAISRDEGECLV